MTLKRNVCSFHQNKGLILLNENFSHGGMQTLGALNRGIRKTLLVVCSGLRLGKREKEETKIVPQTFHLINS